MDRTRCAIRSTALVAALAIAVSGCSASAGAPPSSGPAATPAATSAASAAPASPAASSTPAPTPSTAAASQSPAASAATACDLITPEEVAKVMHLTSPVESSLDDAYCTYDSGALGVLHFSYRPDSPDLAATWLSSGLQRVPGIGDNALWNKADGTFIVIKNNAVVAITFDDDAMKQADRFKFGKAVASIMATRM